MNSSNQTKRDIETTKEMIEVMQAFVNGCEIEFIPRGYSKWFVLTAENRPIDGLWNWAGYNYRRKSIEL